MWQPALLELNDVHMCHNFAQITMVRQILHQEVQLLPEYPGD